MLTFSFYSQNISQAFYSLLYRILCKRRGKRTIRVMPGAACFRAAPHNTQILITHILRPRFCSNLHASKQRGAQSRDTRSRAASMGARTSQWQHRTLRNGRTCRGGNRRSRQDLYDRPFSTPERAARAPRQALTQSGRQSKIESTPHKCIVHC